MRPATAADAAALTALAVRSKGYWGYPAEWQAAWRAELDVTPEQIARERVVVAVDEGGTAVGFVSLDRQVAPGTGEVVALFVDPPHIGTGVGSQLLRDALDAADAAGCTEVLVEADPHAVPFYRRHGFEPVGERHSASVPGRVLPVLARRVPAPPAG